MRRRLLPQVDEADSGEGPGGGWKDLTRSSTAAGIIRIDFIYNEAKGEPFMLEVNTVPGPE